jgi:hypothetical protein
MPESENRSPQSVYDAEADFQHDETRSGRRRRPVADWGGDELFTRMPRRRSGHVVGQRRFARVDADGIDAQHPVERHDWDIEGSQDRDRERQDAWAREEPAAERAPHARWAREELAAERAQHERLRDEDAPAAEREPIDDWGLDPDALAAARDPRRPGPEPRRTRPEPPSAEPAPTAGHEPALPDDPAPHPASSRSTGGVPGRRTVVIGRSGRPESPHPEAPFASVSRRRPPRTIAERIGGQPDRIVGWAFALGLILILVAIVTSHA